jgi:hypothetical protein
LEIFGHKNTSSKRKTKEKLQLQKKRQERRIQKAMIPEPAKEKKERCSGSFVVIL